MGDRITGCYTQGVCAAVILRNIVNYIPGSCSDLTPLSIYQIKKQEWNTSDSSLQPLLHLLQLSRPCLPLRTPLPPTAGSYPLACSKYPRLTLTRACRMGWQLEGWVLWVELLLQTVSLVATVTFHSAPVLVVQ